MAGISDYLAEALLDHVLKTTPFTVPDVYVALSTADPTADGSGLAEPLTADAYARVAHAAWNTAASRNITNDGTVEFPEAHNVGNNADWGTITHVALFDSGTRGAGNMLAYGALSLAKAIDEGVQLTLADESISITLQTGMMSTTLANALLEHTFGNGEFSVPTHLYVGFSTANPGDSFAGKAEPVGNNYARVIQDAWEPAAARATANDGAITSPTASGSWGTLAHWVVMDSLTGGVGLLYAQLTSSRVVGAQDTLKFKDNQLTLTIG